MEWSPETIMHFKEHISYPATGEEILAACNSMSDLGEEEKLMVQEKISPEMNYSSAEEVLQALNS